MAPNLAATPLTEMDAAWRVLLNGLRGAARSALLAEADALYRGGRDDRRRALSCWLALREDLDPADGADAPRVLALLEGVPPGIENLAPLARRAEAVGGPDLRAAASVFLGRMEADEGNLDSAEARFRAALAAARGSGSRAEYLACSSLATLCLRGNREFEALVLARRIVVLAEAAGEETRLRYAWMTLAAALVRLGEWDLLAAPLAAIDRSLEDRPATYERTVRFFTRVFAARRALSLSDPEGALAETEAAAAVEERGLSLDAEGRTLLLLRARRSVAAGRWADAEAHLVAAREAPGPRPIATLEVLGELARCRFETRGDGAGLDAARELLAILESEGTAVHGTGQVLACASALGSLLRARCGDIPEARRAFDAGAAAAVLRIREVNRCLKELPELSAIDPADEALLHRHRRGFVRDHQVLLGRVKDRLLAETGPGTMAPFFREGTFFRVCAWCSRILSEDGRWVPVAHYLPVGPELPVSHGICPPCAKAFATR